MLKNKIENYKDDYEKEIKNLEKKKDLACENCSSG